MRDSMYLDYDFDTTDYKRTVWELEELFNQSEGKSLLKSTDVA